MTTAKSALQNLKNDLVSNRLEKVRILFAPYELLTRVPLTPDLLQGAATFDRLFELDQTIRAGLLAAIDHAEISPVDSPPDIRWGAIFYDAHGAEKHSVYLSGRSLLGAGRLGMIDGNLAKLNGTLVEWFETNFRELTGR